MFYAYLKKTGITALLCLTLLFVITSIGAQTSTNDLQGVYQNQSSNSKAFTIVSKSSKSMEIQFKIPAYKIEKETKSGISWDKVKIDNCGFTMENGFPELPILTTTIAIPNHGQANVSVTNTTTKKLTNIMPYPSQGGELEDNPRGLNVNQSFYQGSSAYPQEVISYSDPQIMRDFRIITVQIQPFSWNAQTKELEVNELVNLNISYNDTPGINELDGPQVISSSFANIYESMILNFDDYRSVIIANTPPKYLMIYGNYTDATFLNDLNNFVLWKKQKGADVTLVSTATTGTTTTAIKAYIQGLYDNINTRPDFVTLIGDIDGSFPVPTYIESWSGLSGHGDYPYTCLAGGATDYLGDVFIGRISAQNTSELEVILSKVYFYEKNMNVGTAQWLNKMLLAGYTDQSGQGLLYTLKNVKDLSLRYNPDYTYTEIYGTPTVSGMNTGINQGVGFFWYRGWIGMNGWSPSGSLINGQKLPHAIIITCDTGSFAGTSCKTEAFIRLGTAAVPQGAVTAIGMDTSHTNPMCNNVLARGIAEGIYVHGMRSMGEALLNGKLFLSQMYGVNHTYVANYSNHWCNLMGDPSMEVYSKIPDTFLSNAPATLALGVSSLDVIVTNQNSVAVEGACVTVTQNSVILARGYTDSIGRVYLFLSSALASGTATVTTSKHDFKPLQSTITIGAAGSLVAGPVTIDDDNTGSSVGNSNLAANSGETLELSFSIKNTSSGALNTVTGSVSSSNPYVTISNSTVNFSNIASGATNNSVTPTVVHVLPGCPTNTVIRFDFHLTDSGSTVYDIANYITVTDAFMGFISYQVADGGNLALDPGETATFNMTVKNNGSVPINDLYGQLVTTNDLVQVSDNIGYFGNLLVGAQITTSSDTYQLIGRTQLLPGMLIPMRLKLYNAAGFLQWIDFTLTTGAVTLHDPVGPDTYGYAIYDMTDTGYTDCPTYSWVGIAPTEGGSGTLMPFVDATVDGEGDNNIGTVSTITETLPFSFKFYGVSYNQMTVCSNGFIAMGTTENGNWANCPLPGLGGPSPLIAPFWDDLITGSGGVYKWYDSTNHKYIVEWYNMKNGHDQTSIETFEVILFDPNFYPTGTGDGPIKIQYNTFNNVDDTSAPTDLNSVSGSGNYCTVGIQNAAQTIGLQYSFNNLYPTAASPLANQTAIYITKTLLPPNVASLFITQTTLIDTNGNGIAEPNENMDVRLQISNWGTTTATSVTGTISETDPWINISTNAASWGSILSLGNATNTTGLTINVLSGCPNNYVATVNVLLTARGGATWNRTFTITVRTPALNLGNITISDPTGNNNGRLDPGETVNVTIPLNNTGAVASPSGSALLTSPTTGITVNTGSTTFASIAAAGATSLTFNVTAASSMTIGTVVTLVFGATAGIYTADKTVTTSVGIILEDFETGNFASFPWTFGGNANWNVDGTTFYAGAYAAKSGAIANSQSTTMQTSRILSTAGDVTFWYKVSSEGNYDKLFFYVDGVVQNATGWSGEVAWTLATYTISIGTHTLKWEYMKDSSQIGGSDCAWVDDIIFPASTASYVFDPPQSLTATVSHTKVALTWAAPSTGTPSSYKVYRNSSLLTSVTNLYYNDTAVTNGTSYAYYVTAVYTTPGVGESVSSGTINATPIAQPAQTLTGVAGIATVTINWLAPIAGTPTGYNIYRNSTLLTNVNALTYTDNAVLNETTYTYYVTAVYATPTSESAASNTCVLTPSANPVITIGTGTSTQRMPFGMFYGYERDAALYLASEIGSVGNVLNLRWYVSTAYATAAPVTIRLATTTNTSLTSMTWANMIASSTTVYTSTGLSFPATGWQTITLATPFAFVSGNLIVMIETNYGGSGTSTYPSFAYTASGTATNQTWYTDTNPPTVTGTLNTYRPNIQMQLGSIEPAPVYSASPTTLPFGSVYIGLTPTMNFTITNIGGGTLTGLITPPAGFTVTAAARNRDTFSSAGCERLRVNTPYSLSSGFSQVYTVTFAPLSAVAYDANITITSNDAGHLTNNIVLTGTGVTPVFNAPLSLTALAGDASVGLNWIAPTGGAGAISGYNVYRNSILITPTPIALTNYNDTGLTNGVLYSYYVTAVYTAPVGESAASNTATATPTSIVTTSVIIGTGTSISLNNYVSPINTSFKSVHGQSIYTAAELNAAGIYGPINIIQAGFYIATAPTQALPNFIVRMKHSTEANVANWQTAINMVTVYTTPSYMPTAGGYQMLTFSTPFLWNGVDNIVLDTAFSPVANVSQTGTIQYTPMTNGYRAARLDTADQTNVYAGTSIYGRRPNIRLTAQTLHMDAPVVTFVRVAEGLKISWSPIAGATHYNVMGSSDPGSGFTQIDEVVGTEYIHAGIESAFFFRIIADNAPVARKDN